MGTSRRAADVEERGPLCDARCCICGTLRNQEDPDGDASAIILASDEEVRPEMVQELHQVCG